MRLAKHWLPALLMIIFLLAASGCTHADKGRILQRENPAEGTIPVTTPAPGIISLPAASYNTGYIVYPFSYSDSTGNMKQLTTSVWYPTSDTPSVHSYGRGGSNGEVAENGTVSGKGPFPLVIFSHGYGGCGLQSVFFTEELARHGYVVVAPDHNDSLMCNIQPENHSGALMEFDIRQFANPGSFTNEMFIDRRDDVKAIIDEFLRLNSQAGSAFAGTIDPMKIGMSGHSLGGYTTMGVIGGWDSWLDTRIGAALMLSPYVQPYLDKGDIVKINIPVMYQGGTADLGITPWVQRPGGAYERSNPPKYFIDINQASHMDWSNLVCRGYDSVSECLASKDKARVIDAYGIAFFDRYLKEGQDNGILRQKDHMLAEYRYQELV